MDLDDILPYVGKFGLYQKLIYVILCIPASIPAVFTLFNVVFISATPEHWCRVPEIDFLYQMTPSERKSLTIPLEKRDGRIQHSRCKMFDVNFTQVAYDALSQGMKPVADPNWPKTTCRHGWVYDREVFENTLVSEMDVVCTESWKPTLATSLFYAGSLFGNILFGYIADKFGRKISFLALVVTNVLLGIIAAFPSNYTAYIVYRTLIGFTFPSIFQIPFIMGLELMSPDKRTFSGIVVCVFFASAMALLAGIAAAVREWFKLSLITSAPFIFLVAYWWILPESPRWLLSNNRIDEAEVIIQKIAKVNKKEIPPNFIRTFLEEWKDTNSEVKGEESKAYILDLFRNRNLCKKVTIVSFVWVVNAVVYSGLSLGASQLGVNAYLAFAISSLVEIPADLLVWYAMDAWGRRWVTCGTMLVGGLACICTIFIPNDNVWGPVILSNIGKFGIAASFAVIYVYAGELFPTVLRGSAMAIGSVVSSVGLIAAPHILYLSELYGRAVPIIIMGIMSVAGATAVAFLPETLNTHLPQTVKDGEEFGKNMKFWSCVKRKSSKKNEQTRSNPESPQVEMQSPSIWNTSDERGPSVKEDCLIDTSKQSLTNKLDNNSTNALIT
ncbi:organic cation transporter 1-like isoform X1 [Tachypleus tridentatus]|uniref:organic cation transporter 1-like isoform X1 n=1 Tax=Tachypleus tridentatus TaxID=6853 RepID=UPI003FD0DE9A